MNIVQKNAEPFFFPGGETGILLVHGFTGSPSEMRHLGSFLTEQGYTVLGVRLAGHGTAPEEMARTSWQDWYKSVELAYTELCEQCKKVFVIGLSMGGILSLRMSLEYSTAGVVAINAPIFLYDQKVLLTPVLKHLISYTIKGDFQPIEGHYTYEKMPVNCVHSLLSLIRHVKKELPKVTVPLLVLQAEQDTTVIPKSADYIFERSGSTDKELVKFPRSGHLLTLGVEREQAAKHILEFVRKHE